MIRQRRGSVQALGAAGAGAGGDPVAIAATTAIRLSRPTERQCKFLDIPAEKAATVQQDPEQEQARWTVMP
jgi:hypothetical protein